MLRLNGIEDSKILHLRLRNEKFRCHGRCGSAVDGGGLDYHSGAIFSHLGSAVGGELVNRRSLRRCSLGSISLNLRQNRICELSHLR